MEAVRMKNRPHTMVIANYDRIDEKVLYQQVKHLLDQNPSVSWGDITTGPSEDLQEGKIDGFPFTLIYDLNYGTEIHSDSEEAIQRLQEYLNGI